MYVPILLIDRQVSVPGDRYGCRHKPWFLELVVIIPLASANRLGVDDDDWLVVGLA